MYRPCLHCEGKRYDENYCPEICTYGEARKQIKELEATMQRGSCSVVSKTRLMELIDSMPAHEGKTFEEALAEHLIANGVTIPVQADNT